ncbi:hypothetical protein Y032_0011g1379 [Ancylostoma ceylanicum]|uniref:Uncharacterized protein n=1 Tax=Ancylostoma ceylanicum TaxID=53326 RepID=A0A016VG94_9BILA|nr:hypothetical protein Y032_0011g1379 [Ancylostoma ceylanicum]
MVTTRRRTTRFVIRPPLPLTRVGYCPAHHSSSERPQASPVRWSRSRFVKKCAPSLFSMLSSVTLVFSLLIHTHKYTLKPFSLASLGPPESPLYLLLFF